jgi:hypothetical protein
MKELDFDELDRAVNSLMTNVPKSTPPGGEEKEKTLDITSTLGDEATPSFDKIEKAAAAAANESTPAPSEPKPQDKTEPSERPEPITPSRPAAPAVPAARRGGRFMDVVHPSADMTKPDTPRPVSRQGVTLEPLGTSQKIADIVPKKREAPEKVEEPEEKPEEPSVVVAPKPDTTMPEKAEEPASTSDWPDPLDMAASKEPEEKKEEAEAPEPEAEEPIPAPLTSPFLPDTKVEKRPLGGVAPEEEEPEAMAEEPAHPPVVPVDETPKTVDDPNAQLPANPNDVELQLPEELSGDLMAVEADTTHDELKQAHESKVGNVSKPAITPAPEVTEPKTTPSEPSVPAGPTSIPQQYREEPSTGDKDNGAIYDTDTYHQPLAHPAKKKSGWMWVIWIALILLLGAGGGAALFLLNLV